MGNTHWELVTCSISQGKLEEGDLSQSCKAIIIIIIIITANRNLNTAAINSRRRMLTDLIGDTLELAVSRATKIFPLTYPYLA